VIGGTRHGGMLVKERVRDQQSVRLLRYGATKNCTGAGARKGMLSALFTARMTSRTAPELEHRHKPDAV
jgi:hypothetical protein